MMLCAGLLGHRSQAQTTIPEGGTIRVYANLMQIPVLILSQRHQSLPLIDATKFTVRLDTRQPFRPGVVRQQGDDPITLAILLDGSSPDALLPLLLESLPVMADRQLTGRDRVAVYGMDGCKLRRFSTLVPASGFFVADSVKRALAYLPYQPGMGRCDGPIGLWDAVDYLTGTLADEPGRRVVMAVTNGQDHGSSRVQAETLRKDANHNGVAIFAVAERYRVPHLDPQLRHGDPGSKAGSWLQEITEGSGGMVIETTRNNLLYTFSRFVQLLRGRYIVEFPRPTGLSGGTSTISIACGQPRAFIRPAGTSVPITDPVMRDLAVPHGPSPPGPTGSRSGANAD